MVATANGELPEHESAEKLLSIVLRSFSFPPIEILMLILIMVDDIDWMATEPKRKTTPEPSSVDWTKPPPQEAPPSKISS